MQGRQQIIQANDGDCARLEGLLAHEETLYRRLLRLAWRQNSYMKRQDVDRLEANAREWNRYLPAANAARAEREAAVTALAGRKGMAIPPDTLAAVLAGTGSASLGRVMAALARLKTTVRRLARQNELNRLLADFCLDLAREESEIFKRCVLDDPSGRYGHNAQRADRGPGGVIVRQA